MSRSSRASIADPAGATTTDVARQHHRFSGLFLPSFAGLFASWILHIWTGGVHWGPINTPGSQAVTTVAVVLVTLVGVGLSVLAYHQTAHHAEHESRRWIQPVFTATVAIVAIMFAVSMGVGPHYWWSGGFLIACWICAIVWSMSRTNATRRPQREHGENEKSESLLDRLGVSKLTRFKAKVVHDDEGEPVRIEVENRHAPGETADVLIDGNAKIESALSAPPGLSSTRPDPDRADRSHSTYMLKDPFKAMSRLGPLTNPGRTIAEPASVADYADGQPGFMTIAGGLAVPNATSYMLIGTSRSGKTSTENNYITDWGSRIDWVCLYLNEAKGQQDARPLLPIIEALVVAQDTEESLRTYVEAYKRVREIIKYRQRIMAEFGVSNWSPRCGSPDPDKRPSRTNRETGRRMVMPCLPFLTTHTGEADSILASTSAHEPAVFLASKGLSTGVNSGWSLQRPDWSSMPTKLRSNIGLRLVHGLMDGETADMAIEDARMRMQMRPENWGAKKPGQHYMMGPGVDDTRVPIPLKTRFLVGDAVDAEGKPIPFDELNDRWAAELLRRNTESAKTMAKLDDGSVEATGGWWEEARATADRIRYEALALGEPANPQPAVRETVRVADAGSVRTPPSSLADSAPRPVRVPVREESAATEEVDPQEEREDREFRAEFAEEVRRIEREGLNGVNVYADDEDETLENDTRSHGMDDAVPPAPRGSDPLAEGGADEDGKPDTVHDRDAAIQTLRSVLETILSSEEYRDPKLPETAIVTPGVVWKVCRVRSRPWVSGEFTRLAAGQPHELDGEYAIERVGSPRAGKLRVSRAVRAPAI